MKTKKGIWLFAFPSTWDASNLCVNQKYITAPKKKESQNQEKNSLTKTHTHTHTHTHIHKSKMRRGRRKGHDEERKLLDYHALAIPVL